MSRKYGYYWVNWGIKWVIAEWCYDDEGGEIDEDGYCPGKDFWCWSGMEIIAEPKEVDECQIVRDSFSSNSEHLLNIPAVMEPFCSCSKLLGTSKDDFNREYCINCGKHVDQNAP